MFTDRRLFYKSERKKRFTLYPKGVCVDLPHVNIAYTNGDVHLWEQSASLRIQRILLMSFSLAPAANASYLCTVQISSGIDKCFEDTYKQFYQ